MQPRLARIRIFPVKSLDPLEVDRIDVVEAAGLAGDREYALFDAAGDLLTAKRLRDRILSVRAAYQEGGRRVELRSRDGSGSFRLPEDRESIEAWFAERLGQPVTLGRANGLGFFDDRDASGPTIIGNLTLRFVARSFGLEPEECRRRFRANLEFADCEAFAEDSLYGSPGSPVRFRVGDVAFLGVKPCARCIVPSLDSVSGAARHPDFAPRFATMRSRAGYPQGRLAEYGHLYRLAVNTRLAPGQGGKTLAVGDLLEPDGAGA